MDIAPPPAKLTSDEPGTDGAAAEPTQSQLRMLRELAELGMALASAIQKQALRQAVAEPDNESAPAKAAKLAVVFTRVAHSVQQSIALEARIVERRLLRQSRARAEQAKRATARSRHNRQPRESDPVDVEALMADLQERRENGETDVLATVSDRDLQAIIAYKNRHRDGKPPDP